MRYRKATSDQDELGQFFTPKALASAVAGLFTSPVSEVLELGAGRGALLRPLLRSFPKAKFTAVECTPQYASALRRLGGPHTVFRTDVLDTEHLGSILGNRKYGTVVGNPPFGEVSTSRTTSALGETFPEVDRGGWIRKDLIFFWESWNRLRPGGEIAIIVASPIVRDPAFTKFRNFIASHSTALKIYQLHRDAFEDVEVDAFVIFAQKYAHGARKVELELIDADFAGRPIETIQVAREASRWDFRYHKMRSDFGARLTAPALGSFGVEIVRGSRTKAEFLQMRRTHIHTSAFEDGTTKFKLRSSSTAGDLTFAEPGDLLVPRVGSRCLLRQALIVSGSAPPTESVYRIRTPSKLRHRILRALESDLGAAWRMIHARGSCAKHLAVSDLMSLPIPA